MAKFNPKEVEEINAIIAEIGKKVKPKMEIGARDRTVLKSLLAANKISKEVIFFKCKREHSDAVISHFINEKKVPRSKYSTSLQSFIFLLEA